MAIEAKRGRSSSPDSRSTKRRLVSATGALSYELLASDGRARSSVITLPHGEVRTPVFMPVGTYGAMKSVPSDDLETLGPQIILANTYHVGNRPGADFLDRGWVASIYEVEAKHVDRLWWVSDGITSKAAVADRGRC